MIDVVNSSTAKIVTLAVNVVNFTAQKGTGGNDIHLQVANNEPINKVVLQKSSNGVDFTEAGIMNSVNSNGQLLNFDFTDVNPFTPNTFYRAKIITSGPAEYSSIAKVQTAVKSSMNVTPSPAKEKVTVTFTNPNKEMTSLRVVNAEGKTVMQATTRNDFIYFDVRNLTSGVYMVQVLKQGQPSDTFKFLVRH